MLHHSLARLVLISATFGILGASLSLAAGSEYYFPQVADGVTGIGSSFYTSSFLISNPQTDSNQITIRFTLPNSLPWIIDLRCLDRPELAGRVSTKTFSLRAGESVLLFTGGVDPLTTGWAKVESGLPLNISEVFDVVGSSTALPVSSEAGVLPAALNTQFTFSVAESEDEPVSGTNIDTGFALVNPSGQTAQVTATLYSRLGSFLGQHLFTLLPGYQTAQFVSQLFNDVRITDVGRHGRVRFSSNINLAYVALRQTYGNSNTISTLTVNPESQLGFNVIYDREPNDTRTAAQAIGALPSMVQGTINSQSNGQDVDTYSVSLKAGTTLYVIVLTDMIGSPLVDSVQVQDANGNLQNTTAFQSNLNGPILTFAVPADGTYYISNTSQGSTFGRGAYYQMFLMAR